MIMMKLSFLLPNCILLLTLCTVLGFSPNTQLSSSSSSKTSLRMGFFDFKPVHGSGSGKEHLDEQWAAQQALLNARRNGNMDKAHMKQKYKDTSVNHLDMMMKEHEAKHKAMMNHMDSMYIDSSTTNSKADNKKKNIKKTVVDPTMKPKAETKKMKFFWEK